MHLEMLLCQEKNPEIGETVLISDKTEIVNYGLGVNVLHAMMPIEYDTQQLVTLM